MFWKNCYTTYLNTIISKLSKILGLITIKVNDNEVINYNNDLKLNKPNLLKSKNFKKLFKFS